MALLSILQTKFTGSFTLHISMHRCAHFTHFFLYYGIQMNFFYISLRVSHLSAYVCKRVYGYKKEHNYDLSK